jgi:RND family efflux transporter MFP subunit
MSQLKERGMLSSVRTAGAGRFVILPVLVSTCLAACKDEAQAPQPPQIVRAVAVRLEDHVPTVVLTGEIRPQVESVQSFRVGGRIVARKANVGDHVDAGDLLASIDSAELRTGVAAAEAEVAAAQAELRQAASAFARQQALLAGGFTTRRAHDMADEAERAARASLDAAAAELATARDQLAHAELHAAISGIVTQQQAEIGEVVQASQPVFTIASDGGRDAVFNVNEAIFARQPQQRTIAVSLVSDPSIAATGTVREVSPVLSGGTGTVAVKVGLSNPPQAMALGASVSGLARFRPTRVIVVPWQALSSRDGRPAVWIADPKTRSVSLRPVSVDRYDAGQVLIRDGLTRGEIVVTAGAQLLRPGQVVAFAEGAKP